VRNLWWRPPKPEVPIYLIVDRQDNDLYDYNYIGPKKSEICLLEPTLLPKSRRRVEEPGKNKQKEKKENGMSRTPEGLEGIYHALGRPALSNLSQPNFADLFISPTSLIVPNLVQISSVVCAQEIC